MLFNRSFLFSLYLSSILFAFYAQAVASSDSDQKMFAKCLAQEAQKIPSFQQRINRFREFRERTSSEVFNLYERNNRINDSKAISVPFWEKSLMLIYVKLAVWRSSPLFYQENTESSEKFQKVPESSGRWTAIEKLLKIYLEITSKTNPLDIPKDLINWEGFKSYFSNFDPGDYAKSNALSFLSESPFLFRQSRKIFFKADPLIDWLLAQKLNSLTHWELLIKTMELTNSDLFNSIAILSEIFYFEVLYASPRNSRAVLATRLKKLKMPIDFDNNPSLRDYDPIGHNFHFWNYLALGIQLNIEGDNENFSFPNLASFVYEILIQRDFGDRLADKMGLHISKEFIDFLQASPVDSRNEKIDCSHTIFLSL